MLIIYLSLFLKRITIPHIMDNSWFKKGYKPAKFKELKNVDSSDIDSLFSNSNVSVHVYNLSMSLHGMGPAMLSSALCSPGPTTYI